MGCGASQPHTEITKKVDSSPTLSAGLATMQGWRATMEDAHIMVCEIPEVPEFSLFAIFDGHGGMKVSKYLEDNLLLKLLNSGLNSTMNEEEIKELLFTSIVSLDCEVIEAKYEDGSTGIICLLTPSHIIVANVGDSRAIMCSNGEVIPLSSDHKPWIKTEKDRIEASGGSVIGKRVNGALAVSRAFGDSGYKQNFDLEYHQQLIVAIPDFTIYERGKQDEFIVLACDGVWDELPNDVVRNIIHHQEDNTNDLGELAASVIKQAFHIGSTDNLSVMIVLLK